MLVFDCKEYYEKVVAFAKSAGKYDSLKENLDYLGSYACSTDNGVDPTLTRCVLFPDFAPYSFEFTMMRKDKNGDYKQWFIGGLIFHGTHDGGGNGGAPTFSVNLSPTDGWAVHT